MKKETAPVAGSMKGKDIEEGNKVPERRRLSLCQLIQLWLLVTAMMIQLG